MKIEVVPLASDLKAMRAELKREGVAADEMEYRIQREVALLLAYVRELNKKKLMETIMIEHNVADVYRALLQARACDADFAKSLQRFQCNAREGLETDLARICKEAKRSQYNAKQGRAKDVYCFL